MAHLENSRPSLFASLCKLLRLRPTGKCSYCGVKKLPLAEGLDGVLICRDCAKICIGLIDAELQRQSTDQNCHPNSSRNHVVIALCVMQSLMRSVRPTIKTRRDWVAPGHFFLLF